MASIAYEGTVSLFNTYQLYEELSSIEQTIRRDADSMQISGAATSSEIADVAEQIVARRKPRIPLFTSNPPQVQSVTISQELIPGLDFGRFMGTVTRASEAIEFRYSYEGDSNYFYFRASNFELVLPKAKLEQNAIVITVTYTPGVDQSNLIQDTALKELARIQKHLDWVNADVDRHFSDGFMATVTERILQARDRALSRQKILSDLGLEVIETGKQTVTSEKSENASNPKTKQSAPEPENSFKYDFFISHASEDKDSFARPLSDALKVAGFNVWFDEDILRLGASLSQQIEIGLAQSRYGLILLSRSFFKKNWPNQELQALKSRHGNNGGGVIIPLLLDIDHGFLATNYPLLGDIVAGDFNNGIPSLVDQIRRATATDDTP